MYHRRVRIVLYGAYEPLLAVFQGLGLNGPLDLAIDFASSPNPDLTSLADVVVCAGASDFAGIRSHCRPEALLIACLSAEEENALSAVEKDLLNDLWQLPLSDYALRARVVRLIDEIQNRDWATFLMGCLDTLINSMPDMVWFKDLDGLHRKVNDYFCEFVGKPREEVEDRTHGEIWGVSEANSDLNCDETDQIAIDSGTTVIAEEVVRTEAGKHLFKTIKTPIRGLDGEILGTVGIAHDLTNMLNLSMELALFIEMMPLPLMICGLDDKIARANARFLKFFETEMTQLLETDWRDWYEKNILHEISPTGEDIYRRFIHADGRVSFLKMISHEMNDAFGNYLGVIHVFEDVTHEKEQEYNIWRLANTDALTGIANRQAFYEYVKRINANEKIHLFYIDLDNFKQVNDVYGHKAGDEALKIAAAILREVFGKDLPARLGGDEFIVCVRREASLEDIEEMAQRLLDLMKEKFSASETLNRVSCSIGVSMNGSMRDGIEPLIKITDSAMYEAKKQGKSRYCVKMAGA